MGSFNKGSFGAGILDGFKSQIQYGQNQQSNALARDRLGLDREKLAEQKRQYDETYKLQQDRFDLDDTQLGLNIDQNVRAKELHPGALAGRAKP